MSKLDFKEMEEKWKTFWEKEKIFETDFSKKIGFSVDTPPPTISGKMHLGHAFSYSQQDFIVRFRRMLAAQKNESVFYPFGTDDNGLPTERLVEKLNKVKSVNISRAEFIELCLKTLKETKQAFVQNWKDIGMSCDFSKTYSTIDDNSRRVSQNSFLDLYKKGHIYKKSFPTIWCPECQTSIAQAELEDKNEKTFFTTLKFFVGDEVLPIATTRPELLSACVCVFVNPKDKRYKKFVGKKAKVPIYDFEVPIIEDGSAEIDKGTGVLMICCYGDRFDVDAVNRHKLKPKTVIEKDGTIEGIKVKDFRKKILTDLKEKNLIVEQKEIEHVLNVHDKCGTPIEFVETPQWFISIVDKKKEFLKQANKINWFPEFMKKRYDNWVEGLEWDWSISRNRHFGVPIPVWECEECNEIILPSEKELPVDPLALEKKCPKCGKVATPEKMVLDTWATSSVTPQIASDLFGNKISIPFSLRPNAHDIIRTWAFYTIVKSYLHEGKIPWKDIVISGVVSLGGEKMSKSKGNVIEPKDILENYGADALRFWAAGAKLGNDLDYQEKDLVAGTKMINKLLNASKFVFMNLENYDGKKPKKLVETDQMFLTKIGLMTQRVTQYFEIYEYSRAKQELEQFFWNDFCNNYLEIVKKRVYQGEGQEKISAQYVLYKSLLTILKMIAPIMPFVTEEIYQKHFVRFEKIKSINLSKWPEVENIEQNNLDAVYKFGTLEKVLEMVRKKKSEEQKPMNSEINLKLEKIVLDGLVDVLEDLKNVTNALEIKEGKKFEVEFVD